MENSPVCHFCPSLWTDKSGQCRLFSVYRISLFLLLFAHKRPSPFFYICPTKNPLLAHKSSILQLNQTTFNLPGSAIIRPTHKPSQNSFYKFRKKITVGVNNVRKILAWVGLKSDGMRGQMMGHLAACGSASRYMAMRQATELTMV